MVHRHPGCVCSGSGVGVWTQGGTIGHQSLAAGGEVIRKARRLTKVFKFILSIAIFLYKLTNGAIGGSMQGLPVLLLTTTGRKSGQPRTVPLGFLRDGSNYVIIASNGGRPRYPGWFFNLKSQPEATIQVKNAQIKVRAEQANPEKRRELWTRLLAISPGYGNYEKRTTREISVMILTPINNG